MSFLRVFDSPRHKVREKLSSFRGFYQEGKRCLFSLFFVVEIEHLNKIGE